MYCGKTTSVIVAVETVTLPESAEVSEPDAAVISFNPASSNTISLKVAIPATQGLVTVPAITPVPVVSVKVTLPV